MPCCSSKPKTSRQQGAVLLFALVCLLALSSMVILSAGKASREALDARRLASEYQADLLAESLVERARNLILQDKDTLTDTLEDPWVEPIVGENYSILIEPCNAWLNINEALDDERVQDAVKRLVEDKNISADAIDYLLDWLDTDSDEERIPGSEGKAYARKWPKYKPRNDEMPVPDEILLIQEFEDLPDGWVDAFLTTWSDKNININFVSRELFEAYLPEIATDWTQVEQWRLSEGFHSKSDLIKALPQLEGDGELWTTVSNAISLSGNLFRVTIEIQLPFVYERRRYILKRNPILVDRAPKVVRGDVLETIPTE